MSYRLFTIGYEKRTINEYIDVLLNARIRVLVDVRETAWSYKRDFCKTKFGRSLGRAGITYVHIPDAGNPKKIRRNAKSIQGCLDTYRTHLVETRSGLDQLKAVITEASSERTNVCLTCFERDVCNCHRGVIVEFMRRRLKPLAVVHL